MISERKRAAIYAKKKATSDKKKTTDISCNKGNLEQVIEKPSSSSILKSKTVNVGARGRSILEQTKQVRCCLNVFLFMSNIHTTLTINSSAHAPPPYHMDAKLIAWCKERLDKNNNVTRGISFQQATCLLPSHCKGCINSSQFQRMKQWFYGGFKKKDISLQAQDLLGWPEASKRLGAERVGDHCLCGRRDDADTVTKW